MSYRKACLLLLVTCLLLISTATLAQISHSEQVQIAPPLVRAIEPPAPEATVAALEQQADELRAQKLFLDALDYYRAALSKKEIATNGASATTNSIPLGTNKDARLHNKIGITELLMQRYKEAKKSFELSIRADRHYADAYNNLGVIYYETKKFGAAVKQYEKAIEMDNTSASFYSNLGAAYFSKRAFEPAVVAYQHALELDPDVFGRTSRAGIQAQLPSPEDRAHYDYTVAKLYAKMGFSEQSLEYLRKAKEEGYKDLKSAYKDAEFAQLRKNPRFDELMAANTTAIPN
jgi:tetratricopeptide (TPR) repeat protein